MQSRCVKCICFIKNWDKQVRQDMDEAGSSSECTNERLEVYEGGKNCPCFHTGK